jgi:hypothetical protein
MARSKPADTSAPGGKAGRRLSLGGRGRGKGSSAAPSGTKDAKPGRMAKTRDQFRMVGQAYKLTRQNDPKLPWIMLITFVAVAAVVVVLGILFASLVFGIVFGVVLGVLAAMIVFGRRAQGSAYRQVEGQPGAAAWVLEGMRGDWRVTAGAAGTPQFDAVHRVLGRPGIVLVGEGSPTRVRGLLAQEKRKVARVVGDTPIYDIIVGDDEGQVPLKKLSSHVMKLPRNLTAAQVNQMGRRMAALGGPRMPVPGGPLPGGKQMTVSQRQVRRR